MLWEEEGTAAGIFYPDVGAPVNTVHISFQEKQPLNGNSLPSSGILHCAPACTTGGNKSVQK